MLDVIFQASSKTLYLREHRSFPRHRRVEAPSARTRVRSSGTVNASASINTSISASAAPRPRHTAAGRGSSAEVRPCDHRREGDALQTLHRTDSAHRRGISLVRRGRLRLRLRHRAHRSRCCSRCCSRGAASSGGGGSSGGGLAARAVGGERRRREACQLRERGEEVHELDERARGGAAPGEGYHRRGGRYDQGHARVLVRERAG